MPAEFAIAVWFGHVGLEIQMFCAAVWRLINSAAIRNAPVPPKLCAVLTRPLWIISAFFPNSNSWVCALNACTPSIVR